jgi:hypothetical protein
MHYVIVLSTFVVTIAWFAGRASPSLMTDWITGNSYEVWGDLFDGAGSSHLAVAEKAARQGS